MKAKDLMMGDYITIVDSLKDGKEPLIYKVIGIGYDGEDSALVLLKGEDACDIVEIDDEWCGIPITPEILEKNGFKYDGSGQRSMMLMTPHGESGTRWNIYVGLKHKTIDVFSAPPVEKSPGWRKHNKVYLEVCGCYVHELQHALLLCGIEKEIIL